MLIVENWAWITCKLVAVRDHGGHVELEVQLESTATEQSYPDLLAQFCGTRIVIRIAPPVMLALPSRLRMRARLAGSGVIWGDGASIVPAG